MTESSALAACQVPTARAAQTPLWRRRKCILSPVLCAGGQVGSSGPCGGERGSEGHVGSEQDRTSLEAGRCGVTVQTVCRTREEQDGEKTAQKSWTDPSRGRLSAPGQDPDLRVTAPCSKPSPRGDLFPPVAHVTLTRQKLETPLVTSSLRCAVPTFLLEREVPDVTEDCPSTPPGGRSPSPGHPCLAGRRLGEAAGPHGRGWGLDSVTGRDSFGNGGPGLAPLKRTEQESPPQRLKTRQAARGEPLPAPGLTWGGDCPQAGRREVVLTGRRKDRVQRRTPGAPLSPGSPRWCRTSPCAPPGSGR